MGKATWGLAWALAASVAACEDTVPDQPPVNVGPRVGAGAGTHWAMRSLAIDSPPLPTGLTCGRFLLADFDHDGMRDILCSSTSPENPGLLVAYQGPPGSFQARTSLSSAWGDAAIAAGDFDRDGTDDIAWLSDGLHIRLARAGRTFDTQQSFPAAGAYFGGGTPLAIGDLDGDGQLDVVHLGIEIESLPGSCFNPGVDRESLAYAYLGDGNGGFAPALRTLISVSHYAGFCSGAGVWGRAEVRLADLSGDGRPDLLVGGWSGWTQLRGAGDGTFGPPSPIFDGQDMRFLAHLNGDDRLDAVIRSLSARLWLSRGKAYVEADVDLPGAEPIAVEDFGDGSLTTLYLLSGGSLAAARSSSTQIMGTAPRFSLPYSTYSNEAEFHVADMNGDGVKDLLFGPDVQMVYGRFAADRPPLP